MDALIFANGQHLDLSLRLAREPHLREFGGVAGCGSYSPFFFGRMVMS
ncbi:MAG: hypothetical protein JWO45_1985 [Spartobacteria bacterium]|nr:hypothetical protein [Spartobacteria bacterium]